jgi:hypothetical protein
LIAFWPKERLKMMSSGKCRIRELLLPIPLVEILRAMKDNLFTLYFIGAAEALICSAQKKSENSVLD